ncbi:dihydropteroate synthase [Citrifermentans bemidjiense Bem]|uniref:Dihydropteroate synthase n=1 Tax=Citrifermentans bemidjiense (strain ATCC BAA-1014 / DSM 16622 / JCM 12645 / Bem) TaxID=404380 RepID=B5EHB0_CITBB|nr:dihydropteroate synthase [Citrifermentans bemidjiense]ACH39646.1 dihydropteroate synthase [Citrifermentans bemidjiense Bem]
MAVPETWQLSRRALSLERPLIMGILNVTPDSFSDGGRFFSLDAAIERAQEMEREGADIIDIGGESTRPNAPAVGAAQELDRVVPVIEALSHRIQLPISIDTYKAEVARAACAAGAEIVNDVTGLMFDPDMARVTAEADAGVVVMHTRGMPDTMQAETGYDDLMAEVKRYLEQSVALAREAGIADGRIVVDPGLGFGKSVQGNLELIKRLAEFRELGFPILVGPSRKSFVGAVTGRGGGERIFGTAVAVAMSVAHGASIIRVHDVAAMKDVAVMARALM